jgi:hypothetical protein
MPRTVEHLVETSEIARERIAAGKPSWQYTLRLSGLYHAESLTHEERRDAIVRRIRKSPWFRANEEFSDLHEAVEELSETTDLAEFNAVFDTLYDLADYDRVWIVTH